MAERVTVPLAEYLQQKAESNRTNANALMAEASGLTDKPLEAAQRADEAASLLTEVSGIGSAIKFLEETEQKIRTRLHKDGVVLPPNSPITISISVESSLANKLKDLEGASVSSFTNSMGEKRPKRLGAEDSVDLFLEVAKNLDPDISVVSIAPEWELDSGMQWMRRGNWERSVRAVRLGDLNRNNFFALTGNIAPQALLGGKFDKVFKVPEEVEITEGLAAGSTLKRHEYNTLIEELNLSMRAYNCLRRSNITTLGGLVSTPIDSLRAIRNLGRKTADEILERVEERLSAIKED